MAGLVDDNQDDVLEQAVQRFVDAQLSGEKPDIEAFARQYPQCEMQLKKRLESIKQVDDLLTGLTRAEESDFEDMGLPDDLIGQQLGAFQITEVIGRGGMGIVYKGHDTRLDRPVAIKAMPGHLLQDSVARSRCQREAKLLASLNHPNIGVIHDILEPGEGRTYLVLEYVPGETLAQRMTREPLGWKDALSIGRQVGEAVWAAHEEGVIHRDLKPGNIMITPDGRVKVLDFGIAKTLAEEGQPAETATRPGRLIGTPAYMSPEQARGKPVDRRSDVWSFGCVLYVMLTGSLPFGGETTTDVLARIIEREPDWTLLPPTTPVNIRVLLRRCLAKDPNRRLQHMGDVVIELDETLNAPPDQHPAPEPLAGSPRRTLWRIGIACSLMGLTVGLVAAALLLRRPDILPSSGADAGPVRRFVIRLPENQVLFFQGSTFADRRPAFAVSPDGSRLVYVARVGQRALLFERRIDQFESRPIPGTDGASSPFFSPDGRSVGFFADEKLKAISLLGGEPVTLCPAMMHGGGSWGSDGMICFMAGGGLARVPAGGGEPEHLLADSEPVQGGFPQVLPSSRAVLISSPDGATVVSLETMEKKVLIKDVRYVRYVPSGHLVYTRAGAVEAVPFNLTTREVTGRCVPVLEGILLDSGDGATQLAFSDEGLLVYARGSDIRRTIPVWVDRQGNVKPLGMPARIYGALKLSPDGKRLAIRVTEQKSDIYVCDIIRGTEIRLTKESNNSYPLWTPDGERIVFARFEEDSGQRGLLWVPADGSGEAEVLVPPQGGLSPWSWSPDGKLLALHQQRPKTGLDISVLVMGDGGGLKVLFGDESTEWGPAFSPDGRYIAYSSNRDGNPQIYVRPYPAMNRIIPISRESGEEPLWSANGDELFYRNRTKWMVVSISTEPEFVAGTPQVLFEGPYAQVSGLSYDVAPDGQRFLVLQPQYDDSQVRELHVVTNWFEELKRLVPPPEAR